MRRAFRGLESTAWVCPWRDAQPICVGIGSCCCFSPGNAQLCNNVNTWPDPHDQEDRSQFVRCHLSLVSVMLRLGSRVENPRPQCIDDP